MIFHPSDTTKPMHSTSFLTRLYIFPSLYRLLPDLLQATWEYDLWMGTYMIWPLQGLATFNTPRGKRDLCTQTLTSLILPSSVAHHSQYTAFQQKELFFKDNLGLIFSISISDIGLSSEDAKRAPENRGQQPLHIKRCGGTLALQSAIARV